ncbi:single-stranded DNA-binding protein [Campylobacter ureolyticus]|uniref:Single-stranded DNA-binding protein n=1 Tax=Campylobacter ureolyticus TaxID=827 RepID=A0A9Q4KGB0_9BACT|nr:single-stranded DNA-binding protein [Campylobacter ureolyticus]MCZ6116927.1 single-stranded DNA-binding protein [Campylobacter ureolyticus]MCZ6159138.1 single-stranded DNA-binding protein [Campylobacter ureolyticus]
MFNKVILVGNLARDIELRYLNTGSAIGKTAIATNRKYTLNGVKKEEICFIDLTFWGKSAEIANQYLKKGSQVLIEGRLMQDIWQDQNGQNRSKHSITVENMQMLGGAPANQKPAQQSNPYQQNNQYQGNHYQNSYQGYNQQPKAVAKDQYQAPKPVQNNVNQSTNQNVEMPDMDDGDNELPF